VWLLQDSKLSVNDLMIAFFTEYPFVNTMHSLHFSLFQKPQSNPRKYQWTKQMAARTTLNLKNRDDTFADDGFV
jgi:hypothetical protein